MKNITDSFGTRYSPVKAFVVFRENGAGRNIYIESYDMDERGFPINAHPLTVRESTAFAKTLDSSRENELSFLKPKGLLPKNVLYINPGHDGYAAWYSPQRMGRLLFVESLGIASGRVCIPPLLWKASKESLHLYGLKNGEGLNEQTTLYHAPFFNIYEDGRVCMGTVKVKIKEDCPLEEFMKQWEQYFFNSYFSHLMEGHNPVNGNIVQLWKSLIACRKKFPAKALIKNNLTIKNILQ